MELEQLKHAYQNAGKEKIGKESILKMTKGAAHPVLRAIKRQLIFESVVWMIFLIVYYDFFDGHAKPLLWNILLVFSVALLLAHNILGYRIAGNPIQAENIYQSVNIYLRRLRRYAFISIASRILAFSMIIGFFVSTIEINRNKYLAMGIVAVIIIVQIYLLRKVWLSRIKKISRIKHALDEK